MKTLIRLKHAHASIDSAGIATLSICEAGSLNILSTPVICDLITALNELASLSELRTLILKGEGDKAFVAGANINEMAMLNRQSAIGNRIHFKSTGSLRSDANVSDARHCSNTWLVPRWWTRARHGVRCTDCCT